MNVWNSLIGVLYKQNKLDEAITQYQKQLQIVPNRDIWNKLGRMLWQQGEFKPSSHYFCQWIKCIP